MKISAARLGQIPLLALLVAGSALIASEASADGKLVPATVCQPLVQANTNSLATPDKILADQTDALERIANIRYSFNGRVLNQSSTKRFGVVCPIVRDNLKEPLNWIRVLYADNHSDPPVLSADKHEVLECEVRVAAGLATSSSDSQLESTLNGASVFLAKSQAPAAAFGNSRNSTMWEAATMPTTRTSSTASATTRWSARSRHATPTTTSRSRGSPAS